MYYFQDQIINRLGRLVGKSIYFSLTMQIWLQLDSQNALQMYEYSRGTEYIKVCHWVVI